MMAGFEDFIGSKQVWSKNEIFGEDWAGYTS